MEKSRHSWLFDFVDAAFTEVIDSHWAIALIAVLIVLAVALISWSARRVRHAQAGDVQLTPPTVPRETGD